MRKSSNEFARVVREEVLKAFVAGLKRHLSLSRMRLLL